MKRSPLIVAVVLAGALPAGAEVTLTPGRGAALATEKCLVCHDGGHIARVRLTRAEWEDSVRTMLARGMPRLAPDEQRLIVDYLVAYYGPGPAPPPAAPDPGAAGGGDPVRPLLTAGACLGCHQVDAPGVGPAFTAVARRYAGADDALGSIAARIRSGGSGRWGDVPMPPNATLTDAEVQVLAAWVLGRSQD